MYAENEEQHVCRPSDSEVPLVAEQSLIIRASAISLHTSFHAGTLVPGLLKPLHQMRCVLVQVCAFWDVLVMSRVEEHNLQASAVGIPLPVELDETELINVSVDIEDTHVAPTLTRAVHREAV